MTLVSCIMPTADRPEYVPDAVACFLAQDYEDCELLIVDDGIRPASDVVPHHPRVRCVRTERGLSLGAKRNLACRLAAGDILLHWDDDDWYPPSRVRRQVEALQQAPDAVIGTSCVYYHDPVRRLAWEYRYTGRPWVAGNTLAYRRSLWERNPFRDVQVGEDSHFVWSGEVRQIVDLADPALCIATVHTGNTSPKRPARPYWQPIDVAVLEQVRASAGARAPRARVGSALVATAAGVGDIIRSTPLIRVLHELGYLVDVLCAPDYPEAATLLEGAPEVARIVQYPDLRGNRGRRAVPELADAEYDVACFTYWALPLQAHVHAQRKLCFEQGSWLRDGDSAVVERLAREVGWSGAMPAPFAVPAARDFQLEPDTIALHAGCKRDWPWKKWHGFPALAQQLEHVVLLGTAEDLDTTGTYFGEPYDWPAHARSYIGQLTLRETAALLQQCAALVCNDSGLQHVAAAVGTPAYPVYGITSPHRELIPISTVRPVTKGLPCEPACRQQSWGRRDCEHHLLCLKSLEPAEVLDRMRSDGITLATRNGRRFEYITPPAESVSVAVNLTGGIGDMLLASALLERVHDELRRCDIDVFYQNPDAARFVFSSARFVRAVHPPRPWHALDRQYDMVLRPLHFASFTVRNPQKLERVAPGFAARLAAARERYESVRGLAERQPFCDGLWGRISAASGRNVLDSLGHLSGLGLSRDSELFLAPDPAALGVLEQRLGSDRRYVVVHDGFDNTMQIAPGAATKCWPADHWQELIAAFRQQHPDVGVVQVGAARSRRLHGVDVDLVGATTLHETAWILKNALLHIDGDSGLAHIARAVHTPAIVLFGPTDPHYYGHAANTNLAPTACGNCWWSTPDWMARCPRGLDRPECMDSIRPETVLEHASARIAATTTPRATASDITCYDGELCRRERATFLRLCDTLELPPLPISRHIRNERSGVYIHASKQWEYLYAIDALADAFPGARGLRIADLGGGRGALAPFLALEGHDIEVFDTDYLWDHAGDAAIETRYREWASSVGYRARYGSLYNVPAPSASFDAVTCISVVEHVPHKQHVLREALRILRPGGVLILTFDFATSPERFEDRLRLEIFSAERVGRTLAHLDIPFSPPDPAEIEESSRLIQADGVCGIPEGMTVAGMVLRRL